MNQGKQNKKGFTLIELLVVIAIVGILATIAIVSLQEIRANARDSKRVADIKQIQTALELYYLDQGEYPLELEAGEALEAEGKIYMEIIPQAPSPADGNCSSELNNYFYTSNGIEYIISFCLGGSTGGLAPENNCATTDGIVIGECPFYCGFVLFDNRDYQQYKTTQIGDQCWMAENLRYLPGVSPSAEGSEVYPYYYVYNYQGTDVAGAKEEDNYNNYGVLYNWPAAMQGTTTPGVQGACPDNWHVPISDDWTQLTDYIINTTVAEEDTVARWLKSCRQFSNNYSFECLDPPGGEGTSTSTYPRWNYNNTHYGINAYGFNSLPVLNRNTSGNFGYIGGNVNDNIWSSSPIYTSFAHTLRLNSGHSEANLASSNRAIGHPLRCLKTD